MKHIPVILTSLFLAAPLFADEIILSKATVAANDADRVAVAWNIASGICRENMNNQEFNSWAEKRATNKIGGKQKLKDFKEQCDNRLRVCLPGLVVSALNPFNMLTPQPWNAEPKWCETAYATALKSNKGIDCVNSLAEQILKALDDKSYSRTVKSDIVSSESNCKDNSFTGLRGDKTLDLDIYSSKGWNSKKLLEGLYSGQLQLTRGTSVYDIGRDRFTIPGSAISE